MSHSGNFLRAEQGCPRWNDLSCRSSVSYTHLDVYKRQVLHAAQKGVFLEDHFSVAACIDFQGVALPNPHRTADFLGNHHPAKVILMCQVKHKIFGALHRCFLLDFCATFMRVPRLPLAHSKYGNPSHTPQRHRRYHRGR